MTIKLHLLKCYLSWLKVLLRISGAMLWFNGYYVLGPVGNDVKNIQILGRLERGDCNKSNDQIKGNLVWETYYYNRLWGITVIPFVIGLLLGHSGYFIYKNEID